MGVSIKYKDIYLNEITEAQANILGNYSKEFIEDGSLKKIENYYKYILKSIEYYIKPSENEMEIVEELSQQTSIIVIADPLSSSGNLFIGVTRQYINMQMVLKGRNLYDEFKNIICMETIDVNTNLPSYEKTVKYYYGTDPEINDTEAFTAEYNADGSLLVINKPAALDDPFNDEVYDATDLNELEAKFPGRPDLSYYLNAMLEP